MEECVWREGAGYWETDCGHEFIINDGQPSENEMSFYSLFEQYDPK